MITDFVIVGSGIAGLSLALKLSSLGNVIIVTKKRKAESNTNYAQGGIASVLADDDNFDMHIKDTMSCGGELSSLKAVEKIVREGPARIQELMDLGVKFTRENGKLVLGKEGGHSRNRIVHSKDLTGKEIERALLHDVSMNKRIEVLEYYMAVDLLTNRNLKSFSEKNGGKYRHTKENRSNNSCYGIYAYNIKDRRVEKIIARQTILATGGLGQVYLNTTNPAIATGDGFAMGYRAGCVIENMEFIQFHPTTLYEKDSDDDAQVFLISEAVRGAGAVLKTKDGKEFMHKYDKRKSLAPRDIVARAIDNEMKKRGDSFVYLDVSPVGAEKMKNLFPNIYKTCLSKGIDISKDMIPVVPAAHYACGGIKTDLEGRTTLRNLYACGEVAMTGVHGANRLASNSLLEAVVFSDAIYRNIKENIKSVFPKGFVSEDLKKLDSKVLEWNEKGTLNADEWVLISHDRMEIKELMNDYVGIVRNTVRLQRAYRRINMLKEEIKDYYKRTRVTVELLELRNLVTVAYMIIESAVKRKESRGLHYMLDYPKKDDKNFKKDTRLVKH